MGKERNRAVEERIREMKKRGLNQAEIAALLDNADLLTDDYRGLWEEIPPLARGSILRTATNKMS